MFDYDKGSKWLIQHHGDAILRLAGIRGIVSWKPLQAEPVHPRRLPDGLIEVRAAGSPGPSSSPSRSRPTPTGVWPSRPPTMRS
jgi:hypothetical protein